MGVLIDGVTRSYAISLTNSGIYHTSIVFLHTRKVLLFQSLELFDSILLQERIYLENFSECKCRDLCILFNSRA